MIPFYNLGPVPWQDSQLLYHALPRLGRSGLFLLTPQTPYVCIGFHQDASNEVDLAACADLGVPVFRREVGGGAVYLDGRQIFYQLVLPQNHPLLQCDRAGFYRRALEPVLQTLRALGLSAHYKPVNDILVNGRKITGSGAAEIETHVVFVGNILLDFNFSMMARLLRVPDEKLRGKLFNSLESNLTTLGREIHTPPTQDQVSRLLEAHFSPLLGGLQPAQVDDALREEAQRLGSRMLSEDWLHRRGRRQTTPGLQIRSGIELVMGQHKAPGGLIRTAVELDREAGLIRSACFSGDFFIHPPAALGWLEKALEMCHTEDALKAVQQVYSTRQIETPGVTPQDWALALRLPTESESRQ